MFDECREEYYGECLMNVEGNRGESLMNVESIMENV